MKLPETFLMMKNLLTLYKNLKLKAKKLKMHSKNKNTFKKCSMASENISTPSHKE
jgi:hypothetical protein